MSVVSLDRTVSETKKYHLPDSLFDYTTNPIRLRDCEPATHGFKCDALPTVLITHACSFLDFIKGFYFFLFYHHIASFVPCGGCKKYMQSLIVQQFLCL